MRDLVGDRDHLRTAVAKQGPPLGIRSQQRRVDAIDSPTHSPSDAGLRALPDPMVSRIRASTHTLRSPDQPAIRCGDAPGITQIQVANSDHLLRRRCVDFRGYGRYAGATAVSSQQ